MLMGRVWSASTRVADLRFAAVGGATGGPATPIWLDGNMDQSIRQREGLRLAGVLAQDPARAAVALARPATARLRAGAPVIVVDPHVDPQTSVRSRVTAPARLRRARRELRREGYRVREVLVLRHEDGTPRLAVPVDGPRHGLRYAVRWLSAPPQGLRRYVDAALLTRVGRYALTATGRTVLLAERLDSTAGLLEAAGLPSEDWVLILSAGDEATRVVLLAFDGQGEPLAAVKTVRQAHAASSFDAEALALYAVSEFGARGAPHLRCRTTWGEMPVHVEDVAQGELLGRRLTRMTGERGVAALEQAVRWTRELARATRQPAKALVPERQRLREQVLHFWPSAPPGLTTSLDVVPAVLAHQDLGTWNILVDESDDITVVDWESAVISGMPIWDLLYLLTDGLALLDGARTHTERAEHAIALHAGALPRSALLFRLLIEAAGDLDLPFDAIGRLATLCWLHHAGSRATRVRRGIGAGNTEVPAAARLGEQWLSDRRLGPDWPALREWHG